MKKFLVLCICSLLLITALIGCSSSDNNSGTSPERQSETTEGASQPYMEHVGQEGAHGNTFYNFYRNTMTNVMYISYNNDGVETMLNADGTLVTYRQWLEFYGE